MSETKRECWVVEAWIGHNWQVYEPCLLEQYAEGVKADLEENSALLARVVRYVPEEE